MLSKLYSFNDLFEGTKILEFNQCQKFDKAPFVIYADLEYLIEKIDGCNNLENSSTSKVGKQVFQVPSAFIYTVVKIG